jgi:hypothetical protein
MPAATRSADIRRPTVLPLCHGSFIHSALNIWNATARASTPCIGRRSGIRRMHAFDTPFTVRLPDIG